MALRDRPLFQIALQRFKENRPLVAAIVEGAQAVAARTETSIKAEDVPAVVEAVIERMAAAPAVVNAMNSEPASQSRVVSGGVWAAVGGLGVLMSQLGPMLEALRTGADSGNQWVAIFGFLFGGGAFGGGVFALFGRLKGNLPPMTRRWWNPFSWLAPAAS